MEDVNKMGVGSEGIIIRRANEHLERDSFYISIYKLFFGYLNQYFLLYKRSTSLRILWKTYEIKIICSSSSMKYAGF